MTSEVASKLSEASFKIFASQLYKCTNNGSSNQLTNWCLEVNGSKENFTHVWVQGYVVGKVESGNSVSVDDGTGIVKATGIKRIPVAKDVHIEKGIYIMFAGELITAGDSCSVPTVKVNKLTPLENIELQEAMWMLEVIDLQLRNPK